MATQKIIVKTGKRGKGTVSRAAIRRAVADVFGSPKNGRKVRGGKSKSTKQSRASVLDA